MTLLRINIRAAKLGMSSHVADEFSCMLFLFGSHFRETQAALDPGLPICQVSQPNELNYAEPIPPGHINDVNKSSEIGNSAVELHAAQPTAPEDPVSVIDSILNENNPGNQSDPLLDRYSLISRNGFAVLLVGSSPSCRGCSAEHGELAF